MGDFNAAVSTLLDAFTSGITVIRNIRCRRKKTKTAVESAIKADESRLIKSLKKNKEDVRTAYTRDISRIGHRFVEGDLKAHLSLASILSHLNAGIVKIIDRLTRGESTRTDYRTLVKLSNTSRTDTIKTFEQLSARILKSSLVLSPPERKSKSQGSADGRKPLFSSRRHGNNTGPFRSKNAPELSLELTVLGSATSNGLLRPKTGKSKSGPDSPRKKSEAHRQSRAQKGVSRPSHTSPPGIASRTQVSKSLASARPSNRISMMSFTSDSTKLGEITEKDGPREAVLGLYEDGYDANTLFPLNPWNRPEKPRSRFARLFRR